MGPSRRWCLGAVSSLLVIASCSSGDPDPESLGATVESSGEQDSIESTTTMSSPEPTSGPVDETNTPSGSLLSTSVAEWNGGGYSYGVSMELDALPEWSTSVEGLPAGKVRVGADSVASGSVSLHNGFTDRSLPVASVTFGVMGLYPPEVCDINYAFLEVALGDESYCGVQIGAARFDRVALEAGASVAEPIGPPGPGSIPLVNQGAETGVLDALSAPPLLVGLNSMNPAVQLTFASECQVLPPVAGFYGVWSLDGELVACPGGG